MNWIGFKRILHAGITNFARNIWLSVAATSVMTITLIIISTVLLLYTLTSLSIDNIKGKIGISVYFTSETTQAEVLDIKDELSLLPEIKEIEFIPKTTALENFKAIHQNDSLLIETLNEFNRGENPLPDSFAIRANELSDYAAITGILSSDRFEPFFDRVRDNSKVIERLLSITNTLTRVGIGLTAVFIIVTIMVMFNTIRLTIYNRREEVEIMRLVGATNPYIRGPFLIEGIMYAVLATSITGTILFTNAIFFSDSIESFLALSDGTPNLILSLTWKIILLDFAISLSLGVIASMVAIRQYLRI